MQQNNPSEKCYFLSSHITTPRKRRREINELLAAPPWAFVPFNLKRRAPAEVKRLRTAFSKEVQRNFVDFALASLESEGIEFYPDILRFWPVHHIIPLSLDGDNNRLALCNPIWHNVIHKSIDKQCLGLEIGETRTIQIPCITRIVWGQIRYGVYCRPHAAPVIQKTSAYAL